MGVRALDLQMRVVQECGAAVSSTWQAVGHKACRVGPAPGGPSPGVLGIQPLLAPQLAPPL